jgi:polyphosphate kinase
MLHDEFFMKRMSGIKQQIRRGVEKLSVDGLTPKQEFEACRNEVLSQSRILSRTLKEEMLPGLRKNGIPILDFSDLTKPQKKNLQGYFRSSVLPILTPLAVDAEHPFPFISNMGLNLAVEVSMKGKKSKRFVRIEVPGNRPRWVPLPEEKGFVPLEQIIAANLRDLFPNLKDIDGCLFRVTRGAEGESQEAQDLDYDYSNIQFIPGSIIQQVTNELKARRFAGCVRLQVQEKMPKRLRQWLARQLDVDIQNIYETDRLLGLSDLMDFRIDDHEHLRYPIHQPITHARLRNIDVHDSAAIFRCIREGDMMLHHPYHNFDTSVVQFIQSAAIDPHVLAIKLTIYRTSSDSPIIRALTEAARRGKQVAVLVEVTARFDEAPNIAWGKLLEQEGVHVAYGVEKLKTHVKLALVVREEEGIICRYLHVGTGNYHSGTARIYEDLGMLTCDEQLCEDAAAVFNDLTGTPTHHEHGKMIVAPTTMRSRFTEMIRREAEHAKSGKPCGIRAKMNQLQDRDIIKELYQASQMGVPITLNVRGLCCVRPGVPGLSENIRVFSVVGRFLEHSRIYCFVNGGEVEYYIGSADWMRRNLNRRVETIAPVSDPNLKRELEEILDVYDEDNYSAWDCQADGTYVCRKPEKGEPRRAAQEMFAGQVLA